MTSTLGLASFRHDDVTWLGLSRREFSARRAVTREVMGLVRWLVSRSTNSAGDIEREREREPMAVRYLFSSDTRPTAIGRKSRIFFHSALGNPQVKVFSFRHLPRLGGFSIPNFTSHGEKERERERVGRPSRAMK